MKAAHQKKQIILLQTEMKAEDKILVSLIYRQMLQIRRQIIGKYFKLIFHEKKVAMNLAQ